MPEQDSQTHWRHVWSSRAPNQTSWFQTSARVSTELIRRLQPDLAQGIIDVGGGASLLVDALLADGYRDLTILDIATEALDHAKRRLADRAEDVSWVVADATAHEHGRQYALWHDRAVFHFLLDEEPRRRYVDRLAAAVAQGGHAIVATFGPDGPTQCSGLPVRRYAPDELRDAIGVCFEPVEFLQELHVTPAGGEQPFLYGVFRRV